MSADELAATTREALAALAAGDRGRRRFGAADHAYALAPPLDAGALATVEAAAGAALPDDLRAFAATAGAGGAGPYRGWIAPARARSRRGAPPGVTAWRRALPVGHLGCGYAAVVPLDGDARGEVWIDARAVQLVAPIYPTFTAYYLDWIDRLARAAWPEGFVPAGACALAAALGGYLGACEHELGLPPGALAGADLRAALGRLGPGAIAIAAEASPLFDDGDRVDPCVVCARMIENLAADGLRRDVVAPGLRPRPER